jgi:hypothetical protein
MASLVGQVRAPIRALFADAGYLSNKNCWIAKGAGATPYIHPTIKSRTAAHKTTAFNDMMRAYQLDPPAWLKTYHVRNTVESMFAAIKRRLGGKLRALARHMIRMASRASDLRRPPNLRLMAPNVLSIRLRFPYAWSHVVRSAW